MNKDTISIVAQCFNEEEVLPLYYQSMNTIMESMCDYNFELIIVDDGSTDRSAEIIKEIAQKDSRVKGLVMSRNFGKAQCCIAGLSHTSGELIVTMDTDLQDPPKILPDMVAMLKAKNADIIATKATTRKGYSAVHSLLVRCFYAIFNRICTIPLVEGQRDYRLMKRPVVDAILQHGEYCLFDKGYFSDVGFHTEWIEYKNEERTTGKTKWPIKRLLGYSMVGIIGYSLTPLRILCYLGCLFLLSSIILFIALLINHSRAVTQSAGLLSALFVSVILCGQFISSGILALYIGQIHLEVKSRPRWIVKDYINIPSSIIDQHENRC